MLFSAFFSGTETAFFSLNDVQLEKLRSKASPLSKIILDLLKHPEQLIITILIGNELVNVIISVMIATITFKQFEDNGKYIAVAISTIVLLFFGEITPKIFAVRSPERWSKIAAKPLYFFSIIFFPVRVILNLLVNFLRGTEKNINRNDQISEEEFKTLVELGKSSGELEEEESEMIQNVFELEELSVLKVMTPRADMFSISINSNFNQILEKIKEFRVSRVPVYQGEKENIVGILSTKELLHWITKDDKKFILKDILHSPILIPGTKKVDELLSEFKKKKTHMAIVVDEYGGVEGLVTMEDLLEELFGDMVEGIDVEKKPVLKLSDSVFLISAMVPVDEFNKIFPTKILEEGFDTLGGYVLHLFGKVPKKGESIIYDSLTFTVEKMKGVRILEVKVEKLCSL